MPQRGMVTGRRVSSAPASRPGPSAEAARDKGVNWRPGGWLPARNGSSCRARAAEEAGQMLRIENVRAGRLPPLSFVLADGDCLAVEGPSGSGKTRLLRVVADLEPQPVAPGGQMFVDGAERRELTGPAWRKLVRYVAAEPGWWTETPRGAFDDRLAADRLGRLLDAVGLGPAALDRPLAVLSTGERQRLALIRALADEPRVLLLDEPTASLDAGSAALVEELIRFQLLAGRSVLLVSHDRGLAARLATAHLELAPPAVPLAIPPAAPPAARALAPGGEARRDETAMPGRPA